MDNKLPTKKSLNVLVDAKLLEEAKNSRVKFSAVMDKALRRELALKWQQENAEAIKAYNEKIEKEGLWIEKHRTW
jgi:antitoxin CcdA